MTGKIDFSAEEWGLVLEGPTLAGMVVSTAERGGSFREAISLAKAYTEARQRHGESALLDEIVSAKPKMDHTRHHSVDELKQYSLGRIREAIGLLQAKATPEELEDYRSFVLTLATRVADAKTEEGDNPESAAEQAAIAEIAQAAGKDVGR